MKTIKEWGFRALTVSILLTLSTTIFADEIEENKTDSTKSKITASLGVVRIWET